MQSTGFGFINNIATLKSGTKALEISILAGKDQDDNQRYNNGSFIVTKNSNGFDAVEKAFGKLPKDRKSLFVKVALADVHATTPEDKPFVNFRGLVNSVEEYKKD